MRDSGVAMLFLYRHAGQLRAQRCRDELGARAPDLERAHARICSDEVDDCRHARVLRYVVLVIEDCRIEKAVIAARHENRARDRATTMLAGVVGAFITDVRSSVAIIVEVRTAIAVREDVVVLRVLGTRVAIVGNAIVVLITRGSRDSLIRRQRRR